MDTSKIFIAAVIAVTFSECLAFLYAWKKAKKRARESQKLLLKTKSGYADNGFFYEILTGVTFFVSATIIEGIIGESITLRSLLLDFGIAVCFGLIVMVWHKAKKEFRKK